MSIADGEKVDYGQHFVKIKLVKDQFSRGRLRRHTVRRRPEIGRQDGKGGSLRTPPLTDWKVAIQNRADDCVSPRDDAIN